MKVNKKVVLASLLSSGVWISGCVTANKDMANTKGATEFVESIEAKPLQGPMTPEHAKRLSKLTSMAVDRVATARNALSQRNYTTARLYLKKASQIMSVVNAEMPAALVVDSIDDITDDIDTTSITIVRKNLVPIYAQLNELDAYMPEKAGKAKKQLDRSRMSLSKNDKRSATKSLELAAEELSYGEVDVKVDTLTAMIAKAQKLTGQGKYSAALNAIDRSKPLIAIAEDDFLTPDAKN